MAEDNQKKSKKNNTPKRTDNRTIDSEIEPLLVAGRLVTKIAHELNNPLDGILRYINLALRALEQNNIEKPKEYLNQCRRGLMRMVQITSELLEFARSAYATSQQTVRVEQIIEDAIKTMDNRALSQNVVIERKYQDNLAKVKSGNLFGVFCNLIKNALDAMPDGGSLEIRTQMENNNSIKIEFKDNGIGFYPTEADVIFEPFYTTKNNGRGTGLGLAICKDIIERCNGRITAESFPQKGSIFTVYLPAESTA
jgi:signal transduction histidine kinase